MAKKKKKRIEAPKRPMTKRQRSQFQRHRRRQRFIFGSGILIIVAVLAVIGVGMYFGWYVPDVKPLGETVLRINDTEFTMGQFVTRLEYQIVQALSQGGEVNESDVYTVAYSVAFSLKGNELARQEAQSLGITISDEEVQAKIDEVLVDYDPALLEKYHEVIMDEFRVLMLQQRLFGEYFDQQVPQVADQRYVMAMFLESQSQANEVTERLEGGEDFAALSAEFCLDGYCKSQKGDLGWQFRDRLSRLVDSDILLEIAFSAETGTLSQPIYEETKIKRVGYWLVAVDFVDAEVDHAQTRLVLLSSEEEAIQVRERLENGEDFAALAEEFSQHEESRNSGGEYRVEVRGDFGAAFDDFVFDPELELGTLSQPIRDDIVTTEGGYWLIKVIGFSDNLHINEADRDALKWEALNQWYQDLLTDPDYMVEDFLDQDKLQWAISHIQEG